MTKVELQRQLVALAQRILKSDGADIVDDGHWGRYTAQAYAHASTQAKAQIDDVLKTAGMSASGLIAERELERQKALLTPVGDVRSAIKKAAGEFGVSESFLLNMAKIESNLNPSAKNGSSRGLFQFQPGAWSTANAVVGDLPPYQTGVFDAYQNARAAAGFTRSNELQIRKLGYQGPISPAVLYMAHQQGAAGFVDLWKVSEGLRDTPKYVTKKAMEGNPPQDKKGVTTDPKVFFSRWMAVAQAKFA